MIIRYFADSDMLLMELRSAPVGETRDLDQKPFLNVESQGHICAITAEHASTGADVPHF